MIEFAFKVDHDSPVYKQYFDQKAERKKFKTLAIEFLDRHGFNNVEKFGMTKRLTLLLSKDQRKKYSNELLSDRAPDLTSQFKARSQTQKLWEQEVISKVDLSLVNSMNHWYFSYITRGRYSLWDYNGEIYGYLSDNNASSLDLSDYMIPIKISEYYLAKESYESLELEA